MDTPDDTYNDEGLECPYCYDINRDAWEMGEPGEYEGETECCGCGKDFFWSRILTVTYKGKAKKS